MNISSSMSSNIQMLQPVVAPKNTLAVSTPKDSDGDTDGSATSAASSRLLDMTA